MYVFLNPSASSVPILYPMKTSVIKASMIFKRRTEMEHCLKIGEYLLKVCDFYYVLNHSKIETIMSVPN